MIRTEGATLRVMFTPGHAENSATFVLEEEHSLMPGLAIFVLRPDEGSAGSCSSKLNPDGDVKKTTSAMANMTSGASLMEFLLTPTLGVLSAASAPRRVALAPLVLGFFAAKDRVTYLFNEQLRNLSAGVFRGIVLGPQNTWDRRDAGVLTIADNANLAYLAPGVFDTMFRNGLKV